VELGHRLKLFRVAADLKQLEVADKLGVTKNYVYMVESGRRSPSQEYLRNFAKLVGISMSVIFLEPANAADDKTRKLTQKLLTLMAEYAKAAGVEKPSG
jgi:transcriptional regulator with XRE-family HTH domain